jgi:hypothetical protein
MNSGVLDLKMRRKVSLAPAVAGADVDSEAVAGRGAGVGAAIDGADAKQKSATGNSRTEFRKDTFIALLDAGNTYRRFMAARVAGSAAK